jgi:hypothetical protein
MAKHPADTTTLDMLEKPRRGRPTSASSMTAAQRKQAQRDRDASISIEEAPLRVLYERLDKWIALGDPEMVEYVLQHIAARASDAVKSRSPAL